MGRFRQLAGTFPWRILVRSQGLRHAMKRDLVGQELNPFVFDCAQRDCAMPSRDI